MLTINYADRSPYISRCGCCRRLPLWSYYTIHPLSTGQQKWPVYKEKPASYLEASQMSGGRSRKQKTANKIDGIVALAMASLEAVRGTSELPLVLMAV